MKGVKRERPNPAILNQAVTTGALPSPHRAHPPAQRVRSPVLICRLPTVCFSDRLIKKPPFRFPEEFRLPIGARKSGMTEPAIHILSAMGNSGFGRLWNGTERVREAMRLGRKGR